MSPEILSLIKPFGLTGLIVWAVYDFLKKHVVPAYERSQAASRASEEKIAELQSRVEKEVAEANVQVLHELKNSMDELTTSLKDNMQQEDKKYDWLRGDISAHTQAVHELALALAQHGIITTRVRSSKEPDATGS